MIISTIIGNLHTNIKGYIISLNKIHVINGNWDAIRKELGITKKGALEEDLRASGYSPFGAWKTTRRKYKKGEFTIDVDSVDYGYEVIEIEILTESRDGMDEATNKTLNFAKESGLTRSAKTGKVSEFLKRNYPEEYKEIRKAWDNLGEKAKIHNKN